MISHTGKWRDSSGLVWTCTKVEGDAVELERTQIVFRGYDVADQTVRVVETLKRLGSQYRRVE